MNLLDKNKSIGALVLGLFLFISCEENGSFGLNGDDVAPVEFSSTDINITSSVVLLDSIRSSSTLNWLVGRVDDPTFGRIEATAYSRLAVNSDDIFQIASEAILDSVRLNLRLNYEADTTGVATNWGVELLTLARPVVDTTHITSDDVLISTGVRALVLATQDIQVTDVDSLYLVDVNQEWGEEIFDLLRLMDASVATQEAFEDKLRGVALKASAGSDMNIRGVVASTETNITMYYREPSSSGEIDRQRTHVMTFSTVPNFYGLEVDRSGTPTAMIDQFGVEIEPANGKRYIQSGTGIVTKINISAFSDLITEDPRIINLAELSVGPVDELPGNISPPPALNLLLTDERNTRLPDQRALELIFGTDDNVFNGAFRSIQSDGNNPIGVTRPVSLVYDPDTRTYRGSITSFLQSYFAGQFRRDELFLYPSSMNTEVSGIAFDPEDIKLSIIFSELQ